MRIAIFGENQESFRYINLMLTSMEHEVEFLQSDETVLSFFQHNLIDILILDLEFSPLLGEQLLRKILTQHPFAPIMVLCRSESDQLLSYNVPLLERRLISERFVHVFSKVMGRAQGILRLQKNLESLVGSSKVMIALKKRIKKLAASDAPALIHGESGTGKELVAKALASFKQPFVAINCSAIPENLFESELFGHQKGAFTGAVSERKGAFLEARGGTLFLDEVGELPLAMQAKLLRVLQEGEVKPVGADHPFKVQVRVITATNRDLQEEVSEGRFREDLYYRLAVLPMDILPLRDRKEDLPQLIEHFLRSFNPNSFQPLQLDSGSEVRLKSYDFPGNIRELENLLHRGVSLADSEGKVQINLPNEEKEFNLFKNWNLEDLQLHLKSEEQKYYQFKLREFSFSVQKLADHLGLNRNALQNRLMRLDISAREEKQRFLKR